MTYCEQKLRKNLNFQTIQDAITSITEKTESLFSGPSCPVPRGRLVREIFQFTDSFPRPANCPFLSRQGQLYRPHSCVQKSLISPDFHCKAFTVVFKSHLFPPVSTVTPCVAQEDTTFIHPHSLSSLTPEGAGQQRLISPVLLLVRAS